AGRDCPRRVHATSWTSSYFHPLTGWLDLHARVRAASPASACGRLTRRRDIERPLPGPESTPPVGRPRRPVLAGRQVGTREARGLPPLEALSAVAHLRTVRSLTPRASATSRPDSALQATRRTSASRLRGAVRACWWMFIRASVLGWLVVSQPPAS